MLGWQSGGDVSPFYDPMIAKIIARGTTRDKARRRLVEALGADRGLRPANQSGLSR